MFKMIISRRLNLRHILLLCLLLFTISQLVKYLSDNTLQDIELQGNSNVRYGHLYPRITSLDNKHVHFFERLNSLNSSKLQNCAIYKQQANFEKDHLSTFIVFVPAWQMKINKEAISWYTPRVYISAILRVRLYANDKATWTIAELKQWIHYQFWAGVGHIYICSHFLYDSERLEIPLKKYVKVGLLTIIPWNNITALPGTINFHDDIRINQRACYNHVLKSHRKTSDWFYSFDMDEYPYVLNDICEGFLTRYLRKIDLEKKFTAIYVDNFLLKGQGDRSQDMLIERINRITPNKANELIKPIYKSLKTLSVGIHGVAVSSGSILHGDSHNIKLLHYWGAREQHWGDDTKEMIDNTIEFNDVRETLAIAVRSSLLTFGEFWAFSNSTGP